ncbi:hypothetical protein BDE02_14G158900 [Populus trichocarpa]|nr:hypothetical protein BDE02_14G158900 [Populus trichocarpa]
MVHERTWFYSCFISSSFSWNFQLHIQIRRLSRSEISRHVVDEQAFQISHDPNNEVKVEAEVLTEEEEGPNSKRSISLPVAKEILKVAREYEAAPVGVFVDDDADTLLRVADAANLEFVQLHGKGSRAAFLDLKGKNRMVHFLHANENGNLLNQISDEECSLVDWILVDSATGGR